VAEWNNKKELESAFLVRDLRSIASMVDMYCQNSFRHTCASTMIKAAEMIEMLVKTLEERNA